MTLVVKSDNTSFSIDSQVVPALAGAFAKPVSEQGPFRHALGAYPLGDMRFTEREALTSRVLLSDLKDAGHGTEDAWRSIRIGGSDNTGVAERPVAAFDARFSGERLDALKVTDPNGRLIKSIAYEYSSQNDGGLLEREHVLLPERFLTVGYNGNGVIITIDGKKSTFMEYPALYHDGGRMCEIDYRPLRMQTDRLPMPAGIVVKNADSKKLLRQAQMSNYVVLSMSRESVSVAAREFARLNAEETAVWHMLDRRWSKPPDDMNDTDMRIVNEARRYFESTSPRGMTTGEQLKRINMLLNLDLIQRHSDLAAHFQEYLSILVANGLRQMVLEGGPTWLRRRCAGITTPKRMHC